FFADLLLKSDSRRDGNQHHDHTDRDCSDCNFYNRRRNTTFTVFRSYDAFGDKIFKIHNGSMTINFFKNTVFLIVLTVFSCGSSMAKVAPQPKEIIVGAERFAEYEHLLQNKAGAIVGNQTSFLQAEDLHLVDFLLSKNIN